MMGGDQVAPRGINGLMARTSSSISNRVKPPYLGSSSGPAAASGSVGGAMATSWLMVDVGARSGCRCRGATGAEVGGAREVLWARHVLRRLFGLSRSTS